VASDGSARLGEAPGRKAGWATDRRVMGRSVRARWYACGARPRRSGEAVSLSVPTEMSREGVLGGASLFEQDCVDIRVIERVDGRLIVTAAIETLTSADT
jgi:hypothetical protein